MGRAGRTGGGGWAVRASDPRVSFWVVTVFVLKLDCGGGVTALRMCHDTGSACMLQGGGRVVPYATWVSVRPLEKPPIHCVTCVGTSQHPLLCGHTLHGACVTGSLSARRSQLGAAVSTPWGLRHQVSPSPVREGGSGKRHQSRTVHSCPSHLPAASTPTATDFPCR